MTVAPYKESNPVLLDSSSMLFTIKLTEHIGLTYRIRIGGKQAATF